jgi:hypothetical protein
MNSRDIQSPEQFQANCTGFWMRNLEVFVEITLPPFIGTEFRCGTEASHPVQSKSLFFQHLHGRMKIYFKVRPAESRRAKLQGLLWPQHQQISYRRFLKSWGALQCMSSIISVKHAANIRASATEGLLLRCGSNSRGSVISRELLPFLKQVPSCFRRPQHLQFSNFNTTINAITIIVRQQRQLLI